MADSRMLKVFQPNESPPTTTAKPKRKFIIAPIQLNNSFSGQCYFPHSVGMLQAYVQKHLVYPEYFEFLSAIYSFMPITEIVSKLEMADVLILSLYGWNFENSMTIVREWKQSHPSGLVIVGGPQVPDSKKQFQRIKKSDPNPDELKKKRLGMTEEFHRNNPGVDIAVHGEGERIFKLLLEQLSLDGLADRSQIPSISYIDTNGEFRHNPKLERMHDLSEVPSPYLEGIYESLIIANPNQKWIAMWETNRGCPYQCTYCDWGGAIEDKISLFPIRQKLKEAFWFGRHKIPYIFIPDANFGLPRQDVKIAKFLAKVSNCTGYPQGVSVQNAKNPKPHTIEALEILEKAGLNKSTVMSIQSKNKDTLKAVRRENMRPDEYRAIQRRLRAEGIPTLTDYIIPMPEETYDSVLEGISEIISDGQHDRIQFNNLSIWPNAEMGDPEQQEKYGMELVRIPITNIHGKKNASISGIEEYQYLVVATNSMPKEAWVKTRALCYMVALTYFDKLLQIPIMILHEVYGISYRKTFELFMEAPRQSNEFPIFREILDFFENFCRGIQSGTNQEFYHSKEYLDILWPADEFIFIRLCREGKLEQFYNEAEQIMINLIGIARPGPLWDSVMLNRSLIRLPFKTTDLDITLEYNIWEIYQAGLFEEKLELKSGPHKYLFDRTTRSSLVSTNCQWDSWEEWYEKVIWWGSRQGAYLYANKNHPLPDLEGHH